MEMIAIPALNTEKNRNFVVNKIPIETYFNIPFITTEQVSTYLHKLELSNATGLDGLGPRVLKITASVISPSITLLINKSIATGIFPVQLKFSQYIKGEESQTRQTVGRSPSYRQYPKYLEKNPQKHINTHLMGFLNKYKLLHESQSGFRHKHRWNHDITRTHAKLSANLPTKR